MREDFIHYYVRRYLLSTGWALLAGQYPNGSDDLPALNVVDPQVARDRSPDPRRHSKDKLVPDLVSLLDERLLVIEMKPSFDAADAVKLLRMRDDRRADFDRALLQLADRRHVTLPPLPSLRFIPVLAFQAGTPAPRLADFCYLRVDGAGLVAMEGPF